MSGPAYDGDHVDLSGSTFHGKTVGKEVHHHTGPTPTALWGLPAPATGFSGRERELADLLDLIDPRHDRDAGVVVSAVSGMGGIGKTALAVVAGDRALSQGWFCGAVFVNLRGYDPCPATPGQGLEALLRALGVKDKDLPPHMEERAALYRSQLTAVAAQRGGPVLVVADNASSADQVRPLLPGMGGHRLLVTSRDPLDAIHARRLALAELSVQASVQMMAAVMAVTDSGDGRLEADPAAGAAIATACGGLPLALLVCVSLLRADPDRPLNALAAELADPDTRLHTLDDGYRSITALFALAVKALPADQERMFTLVGIAPGREITTPEAAVLTDSTDKQARTVLRELARAQLVTRMRGSDRWGMHDLTRAFARYHAQTRAQLRRKNAREQKVALVRLLDHLTTTAEAADDHLRALPGDTLPSTFSAREEAMDWLDERYDVLIEAVHTAQRIDHSTAASRLPMYLAEYLSWRRSFGDQITITTIARDAFAQMGDHRNEAMAWNSIGIALREAGRLEEAIDAHERARDFFHRAGNLRAKALVWNNLGTVLALASRTEEAIDAHTLARDTFHQDGDHGGEAMAWNRLGAALREQDRLEEAIEAHGRARELHRQIGDRRGEAMAWDHLGIALRQAGRFEASIDAHERALALALQRQVGNSQDEANAWLGLGLALAGAGRTDEARHAYEQAMQGYRDTGDTHRLGTAEGLLADLG